MASVGINAFKNSFHNLRDIQPHTSIRPWGIYLSAENSGPCSTPNKRRLTDKTLKACCGWTTSCSASSVLPAEQYNPGGPSRSLTWDRFEDESLDLGLGLVVVYLTDDAPIGYERRKMSGHRETSSPRKTEEITGSENSSARQNIVRPQTNQPTQPPTNQPTHSKRNTRFSRRTHWKDVYDNSLTLLFFFLIIHVIFNMVLLNSRFGFVRWWESQSMTA